MSEADDVPDFNALAPAVEFGDADGIAVGSDGGQHRGAGAVVDAADVRGDQVDDAGDFDGDN